MSTVPTGTNIAPATVNRHPYYNEFQYDWMLCRDAYRGERAVKDKKTVYLPPLQSHIADGMGANGGGTDSKGWCDYQAYIARARFHARTKEAVRNYMGMLWHKEPTIQLPKVMEPLLEKATRKNESLMQLLRNMHVELLVTGRLGLFADIPKGESTAVQLPYISMYLTENIINWDAGEPDQVDHDSLNLVVLDESRFRRKEDVFTWMWDLEYRVLCLGDPLVNEQEDDADATGGPFYQQGLFRGEVTFNTDALMEPKFRGKRYNKIPFVFVNSRHVGPDPEEPPQLNLARCDLGIYRSEADFRQLLHMQTAQTLTIIGEGSNEAADTSAPIRTGVGAVLRITNPQGDAKYIGATGTSLAELRTALENDLREAELLSGQLTDNKSTKPESGDALGKRMAGQSASLMDVALTSANGLQTLLRMIAEWIGVDPLEVEVTANTNFAIKSLTPQDLLFLQQGKVAGLPISDESMHMNIQRAGLTEMDYDTEKEGIANEEPRVAMSGIPLNAPPDAMQKQQMDAKNQQMQQDAQNHAQNLKNQAAAGPPAAPGKPGGSK